MNRTARVLSVTGIIAGLALGSLLAATSIVQHHHQMDTCAATYRTQFVPQPDGRPAWTSDACRTLSLDDKATVHGRVTVAYQVDTERALAAAKASAMASTGAAAGAADGVRTASSTRAVTP